MNNDHSQPTTTNPQVAPDLGWMKKLVLLVDVNSRSRDSRAKIMRALGVTVHSAATVRSARLKLASEKYSLVLVDLGSDDKGAESLAQEIKLKDPRQRVAFLVGSPLFLATSLDAKRKRTTSRPASRVAAPVRAPDTPAAKFDFGQKIRDAEAKQVA